MIRSLLLGLAFLILIVIGLVWMGVVNLNTKQDGQGVEVQVKPVEVGTTTRTVPVPVIGTEQKEVRVPSIRAGGGEDTNQAQSNQVQTNAQ